MSVVCRCISRRKVSFVAVLTAVLDDAQHLELDVHRVLLEALEQEIFQLQTRVDRGVCDARNLVEHVARRGFGGVGSGLGDEGFVVLSMAGEEPTTPRPVLCGVMCLCGQRSET